MRTITTSRSALPSLAVLAATLVACRGRENTARSASAPATPNRVATVSGLEHPEAARYDSAADLFYVSNINGDPLAKDGNGFISRVRPDGTIDSLHFIAGGRNGVTLNAPKGLALVADTLWVADIDAVRAFNKRTGASVATIDLSASHALFLNDIAVGPDGALYITDTGLRQQGQETIHPERSDRIFRIAPDHSVSVALQTDLLGRPNGIAWDAQSRRFIVVPYGGSSAIFAWHPGDTVPTTIGHHSAQMDGVEVLPDGRLLVTSWKDSSLAVRTGEQETVIKGLPSPADIGVDLRRNQVAVPLLLENRVEIWSIPPRTP